MCGKVGETLVQIQSKHYRLAQFRLTVFTIPLFI